MSDPDADQITPRRQALGQAVQCLAERYSAPPARSRSVAAMVFHPSDRSVNSSPTRCRSEAHSSGFNLPPVDGTLKPRRAPWVAWSPSSRWRSMSCPIGCLPGRFRTSTCLSRYGLPSRSRPWRRIAARLGRTLLISRRGFLPEVPQQLVQSVSCRSGWSRSSRRSTRSPRGGANPARASRGTGQLVLTRPLRSDEGPGVRRGVEAMRLADIGASASSHRRPGLGQHARPPRRADVEAAACTISQGKAPPTCPLRCTPSIGRTARPDRPVAG